MRTSSALTLVLSSCLLGLAACGGGGGGGDVVVDDPDSTLLVVNESDFVIEEIYITDVDASGWGPDLTRGDVLFPDEEMLLTDLPCDFYDVLMVDETGLECEVLDIDLCFDDATWVITNDTCDVFAAEARRRAQLNAQPLASAPTTVTE
jgi:hypothetical protein